MNKCPVCKSEKNVATDVCERCGYDFLKEEISRSDLLKSYLAFLKNNWVEQVTVKSRVNDIQIEKYGRSSTSAKFDGWSITETATKLLGEDKSSTSRDIKLFKELGNYPKLKNCKNKGQAYARLKELNNTAYNTRTINGSFDYEKELQNYLEENWRDIPLGKDWCLYKSYFDIGEIGIIDLLAKKKENNDWLVVELKKDQSSDQTVGQILRYMGWIKEHRLEGQGRVEGLIVSRSIDEKIRYAVSVVPKLRLMIYSFHDEIFSLDYLEEIEAKEAFEAMSKKEKEKFIEGLKRGF